MEETMKKTKLLAFALAVALLASLLAGCKPSSSGGGASQQGETIKIGGLAPLTGEVSVYGNAVINGAKLYIEEYNASRPEGAPAIEFIVYDEKGDSVEAVNAYNRLVDSDKVVAILGDVTSAPTIAVAELAAAINMPMVTASATAEDVTKFGDNMFRACFLDPFQGKTMADFAKKEGAKKVAVIYNTGSDYSTGLAKAFEARAKELGMEVVAFEGYADGDKDFRAQLTNIAAKNADMLFVPDYYNTATLIAGQAKETGVKATLLGADGWDGILGVTTDMTTIEGAYFSNHFDAADEKEIVANFMTNYKAKYNETPNSFGALGYDAARILVNAVTTADSTDGQAIIDALNATDLECVTGRVTYDDKNNPVKSCAIMKITEGAAVKYDEV